MSRWSNCDQPQKPKSVRRSPGLIPSLAGIAFSPAAAPSEAETSPDQLRQLKEDRRLCRSTSWEHALQTPLPTTPRLLRAHSGPTAIFQDTNIVALLISRSPLDVVSCIAMTCTGWALMVAELFPDRTENTCLVVGSDSCQGLQSRAEIALIEGAS